MPEKTATQRPLAKLSSGTAAVRSAAGTSFSRRAPARPQTAMPARQTRTPARVTWPESGEASAADLALEEGRDDGAEDGAEAEGQGVAQRQAQVAHGQAEGQAADTPQNAQQVGPEEAAGRGAAKTSSSRGEVSAGRDPWRDDPAEDAADEPVQLPGPAAHLLVGKVEASGGQAAEGVQEDAEERLGVHRR